MPGFKTAFVKYLAAVESLSYEFVQLVAEALGLAPDGLAQFFDARERMQHRAKVQYAMPTHLLTRQRLGREADRSLAHSVYQIVKYPTRDEVSSEQGVGPHFDAGFLTFVSPPLFFGAFFPFPHSLWPCRRSRHSPECPYIHIGLWGHETINRNSFQLNSIQSIINIVFYCNSLTSCTCM